MDILDIFDIVSYSYSLLSEFYRTEIVSACNNHIYFGVCLHTHTSGNSMNDSCVFKQFAI